MRFSDALRLPALLAEGAVSERLRRDPRVRLDPDLAIAGFLYSPREAGILEQIYREYLGIAADADLPLLCFAPTWRADPVRLRAAGMAGRDVNGDGVRFLRSIAADYPGPVFVGGLVGCRGDCYKPEEALGETEAAEFHREQARALAAAGPDLLFAATLPAISEAVGMARALAGCGLPYAISFVLGRDGAVLDGTPLAEAAARIDREVAPAPAGYFVNCTHPTALEAALERAPAPRLVGFQANTSRRNPQEREGLAELDTEDPETLATAMLELHRRFGIRVLGGCCGTDGTHIRALAGRLSRG